MSMLDAINQITPRITETFGEPGRRWLAELPALLQETAERHNLQLLPPYPNLTYNYVTPAVSAEGRELVLKLGVPNRESTSEIAALRWFSAQGAVEIIGTDPDAGILILERLMPGRPLTPLANDQTDSTATSIACGVMRVLHRDWWGGDHGKYQTVMDLGNGFHRLRNEFSGGVGPFPRMLVEEAEQLWSDLCATLEQSVLLHGDLHHDNIISATRSPWLAIDPKGYVGDPVFETGAILRNLWQDRYRISNPAQTIRRRIDQFADELKFDRARVRGWGLAQAVLSVWWSYEDGDPDWADSLAVAEMIAGMRD